MKGPRVISAFRTPLIFAIFLLLAVCTILVAASRSWFGLCLNREIKPLDVATLAVSLFVAYFLQYYLGAKVGDDRAEKDLLIGEMKGVLLNIRECRDIVRACYEAGKISKAHSRSILLHLRRISNGIKDLDIQVGLSQCNKLSGECKGLMQALFKYKEATTGGSFPSKPYDILTLNYQEKTYNTLSRRLQGLIFKVNQHR